MTTTCRLLLKVQTDAFRAGALWEKIYGIWSCTKSARTLSWMKGMNRLDAKLALLRMGASFNFLPLPKSRGASTGHQAFRSPDGTLNIAPCDLLTPRGDTQSGIVSDPIAADNRSTTRTIPHQRRALLTTGRNRPVT